MIVGICRHRTRFVLEKGIGSLASFASFLSFDESMKEALQNKTIDAKCQVFRDGCESDCYLKNSMSLSTCVSDLFFVRLVVRCSMF